MQIHTAPPISTQGNSSVLGKLRLLYFLLYSGGGRGHLYKAEKHNAFPLLESSQLFSGQENYLKPIITKS